VPRTLAALAVVAALAPAAPVPKAGPKPTGVLVLDNCDPAYLNKETYADNLTLLDADGKGTFSVSGFNNCESIGSSRMVAVDPARKCVWVIENVAGRLRRFDQKSGKETLSVDGVKGSAVAVDPDTGNVWALTSKAGIGTGKTVVYDPDGKLVATHDVSGWDIAYDPKGKAFWIADNKLTKITVKGEVVFTTKISTYCASSVDVDPNTGAGWVAVRNDPQINGSTNELLKFDADGKELARVDLGKNDPFRVSLDPKDGGVWVAHLRKAVERFSAEGKSEVSHAVEALAVQVDPAGGDVWVVTPTEVQRMSPKGEVSVRAPLAGKTTQAWIAAVR
jgi:hypothetical protein